MTRFFALLGVLMCLTLLGGCTRTLAKADDAPASVQTDIEAGKLATFTHEGSHTSGEGTERTPMHELKITFFTTGDSIIAAVTCEHGAGVITGSQAVEMYKRLSAPKPATKPKPIKWIKAKGDAYAVTHTAT